MFLDNTNDIGHHMMEWDLGHWIPMIFGWGIILLVVIIILYLIIKTNLCINKENQMNIQGAKSKRNEFQSNDYLKDISENANFCYHCGEKLDHNQSNYCPKCGIII